MTSSEGVTRLTIVIGAGGIAVIITGLLSMVLRPRRGLRQSLLPPLLVAALSVLAVAFTHVWIGGQIKISERGNLWSEGTITAFPTSLTALGATLISLWVVLWTAENTVRTTQRHDQTLEAEERRQQGAELISLLISLDDVVNPLREYWIEGATHAALWSKVDALWQSASGGVLGEPSSLASSDPCRKGHRMGLPDPNCLTPSDTPGRVQIGCIHFNEFVATKLHSLQQFAISIAVNKVSDANRVRGVLETIEPLIDKYGLPSYDLLSDARRLSSYYPINVPDPKTAEGQLLLAKMMTAAYLAGTAKGAWTEEITDKAAKHGVEILEFGESERRARWTRVYSAAGKRTQLRRSLLDKMQQSDQVIGVGLRSAFWEQLSNSIVKGDSRSAR